MFCVLHSRSEEHWIGLHKEGHAEAQYRWTDGHTLDPFFNPWMEELEAPEGDTGACVAAVGVQEGDTEWVLRSCDQALPYVCQYTAGGEYIVLNYHSVQNVQIYR